MLCGSVKCLVRKKISWHSTFYKHNTFLQYLKEYFFIYYLVDPTTAFIMRLWNDKRFSLIFPFPLWEGGEVEYKWELEKATHQHFCAQSPPLGQGRVHCNYRCLDVLNNWDQWEEQKTRVVLSEVPANFLTPRFQEKAFPSIQHLGVQCHYYGSFLFLIFFFSPLLSSNSCSEHKRKNAS